MIVSYERLKDLFGGSSTAELVVRLQEANVKFLIGKRNQPFTTEDALNKAMGILPESQVDIMGYTESNHIEV